MLGALARLISGSGALLSGVRSLLFVSSIKVARSECVISSGVLVARQVDSVADGARLRSDVGERLLLR